MPPDSPRNPAVVLACVFAAFAGGPALGVAAAHWAAPGSELAQIVSPLAFALAFAGGMMSWFGIGVVAMVGKALWQLARGRGQRPRRPAAAPEVVPPGYGVFLPLAVGLGLAAGVVVGLLPRSGSFWLACAVHVAAGALYGGLLRALARHRYLPFPEPE